MKTLLHWPGWSCWGAAVWFGIVPLAAADGLGRHKQLYLVPTPGPVTVDGRLDDWDLSGQIEMYVASETRDRQSAKFAAMYDAEALYLSGAVRDPTPLVNRHDPRIAADKGWDADSCQFRLTLDPSQPYPITESVWPYRKDRTLVDRRDDIVHMTLWHFTDRDEPCLVMRRGMTYRLPRPEWAPHGVVPATEFRAQYRLMEDGGGYTFEYRIPWATLGARTPLRAGDRVAGTVQFNWGRPDGLKTDGTSGWAYDVMAGPGFVYQNAAVWGRLILYPSNSVPRELVAEGVPRETPLPLEFSYELPRAGQITLQLFDRNQVARRILVAQGDRRAGRHTERWDGLDDQGEPLPPGDYTMRGIIHEPITTRFLFSVHNSGQPPYPTDDHRGGWGGDHGVPTACAAIPGGMILAWSASEYGWGIIRVDLEGRKLWGARQNALLLAHDGRRLFFYDPHGFHAHAGVQVLDLADSRILSFAEGRPTLAAPPGGDKDRNSVTGLAHGNGRIFVSYRQRDLIAVFDATNGELKTSWPVPAPGPLAVLPDGDLAVISQSRILFLRDGQPRADRVLSEVLTEPTGLAVDAAGRLYVSTRGPQMNIAVFEPSGKLARRIGKPGGRPAVGDYDAGGLYLPAGLAVDERHRLWVAEEADFPKRISVWDSATGALDREFFGGSSYFGYAHIDPAAPNEIYCHNVLWQVDWDRLTATPRATIWRRTAEDQPAEPSPTGQNQGFRVVTAADGRQYGWGAGRGYRESVLYRRDGNVFKPFLAAYNLGAKRKYGWPELDDPARTPNGIYLWQDDNDDQRVQRAELHRLEKPPRQFRLQFHAVAPDLTVWCSDGYRLHPVGRRPNGRPVYDANRLEPGPLAGQREAHRRPAYLWLDTDGAVYTLAANQLSRWNQTGRLEWAYPNLPAWQDSLGRPVVKAGRLYGLTGGLGVAGPITGNMTYFGPCHLFHRDGTYVAAVMRDARAGGLGAEVGQPEGQGGSLVRLITHPGQPARTLLLAGGQDGRVTEILGLDSIQPLPPRTYPLTEEQVRLAAAAHATAQAGRAPVPQLVIARGREAVTTAAAATRQLDGVRGFSVRLAHDEQHLYAAFDVTAPADLVNSIADPKLIFKGGNCLDLQFETANGPVRLLVTRQRAEPVAVLFRPKIPGFSGQPIVLRSPTGEESFDEITVVREVTLSHEPTPGGFQAMVRVPLATLGLKLTAGQRIKADFGYRFGNATGTQVAARAYLFNDSFTANVVNDIPHESRLEPARWGEVAVE